MVHLQDSDSELIIKADSQTAPSGAIPIRRCDTQNYNRVYVIIDGVAYAKCKIEEAEKFYTA